MRSTVSPRALRHVRAFSSTARRLDTYGFIGLGQMGYQMARNLQSKLPPSDTVRLFDINRDAMQKLAGEMKTSQAGGAAVELAESVGAASAEAASTDFLVSAADSSPYLGRYGKPTGCWGANELISWI